MTGIEKNDSVGATIMDIPGGNFYTNAATFSKEAFENKGVRVLEYTEPKINQFPAKLIFVTDQEGVNDCFLVFGDTTFSVAIMAMFPPKDKISGQQIREMLQTIYYDKSIKIDPFAVARFKVNDSSSQFKFSSFAGSIYIYSLGGIQKDSASNDPIFMITPIPAVDNSTPEVTADLMLYSLMSNRDMRFSISEIKDSSSARTNGLDAFSRTIYGLSKGQNMLVFQHIVHIGNQMIVMQGIARSDFEKNLGEFKKISNTIKSK